MQLSQGGEVEPMFLMVVDIHLKILLQDLVDPSSLTVSLRLVGSQEVDLDSQQLEEQPPKLRDEVLSPIRDNVGWGAIFCEDL